MNDLTLLGFLADCFLVISDFPLTGKLLPKKIHDEIYAATQFINNRAW
jgi:hypothetical protein